MDISDKGVFFSVSVIRFFKSPNFQKERFQKTILDLKFKFPSSNTLLLLAGNLNFKFRIVFWNFFFLRFGVLKNTWYFLKKKPPLIKTKNGLRGFKYGFFPSITQRSSSSCDCWRTSRESWNFVSPERRKTCWH